MVEKPLLGQLDLPLSRVGEAVERGEAVLEVARVQVRLVEVLLGPGSKSTSNYSLSFKKRIPLPDQIFSWHTFLTCEHELRVLKWPAREKSPGLPSSYCVPAKTSSSRSRWLSSTTRSGWDKCLKLCLELCFYLALLASTSMPRPATASEKRTKEKRGKEKISAACFDIKITP